MMDRFRGAQRGAPWLELLLVLALLALVYQLIPSLWKGTLWPLDVRNWPRTAWFAVNWVVLLALVAVRFGPDLYHAWQQRRERLAVEREKQHKQQELKEQREAIERIQQARSRRVY